MIPLKQTEIQRKYEKQAPQLLQMKVMFLMKLLIRLFNCLRKFEAKVMEIYGQGSEIKNMHIKDKKQLLDLGESAKFITSKLGELEKDQKEKEKIINNLKGELSYVSEKLRKMEESIDS